jgi:Homeodomain-like domain
MEKRYPVRLLPAERAVLGDLLAAGAAPARTLTHARVLLKADQGPDGPAWHDARIAEAPETSLATVARVRRRWAEGGLDGALHRRPTGPRPRKLDGAQEARLVAVACSAPPAGHERWTLRLLADKLVELEIVDGIAPNTVRTVLKKTSSSRG